MSKYTTEVRFICEQKAGLENSAGFTQIDDILDKSWNKIFTSSVAFFDESYKPILCTKILKHYYTREICAETVGLWQLWLNTRLEEIMPYYNELYKSAQLEFKPFDDVNYTRESSRGNTENENAYRENITNITNNEINKNEITENTNSNTNLNDETTSTSSAEGSANINSVDKYSDTPQGSISNLSNDTYLTNAKILSNENSFNNSGNETNNKTQTETNETNANKTSNNEINSATNNTQKETNNRNKNQSEDYFEKIIGKQGGKNYSEMLIDFRKTFLNIDMQVISDFSDLFFNLW